MSNSYKIYKRKQTEFSLIMDEKLKYLFNLIFFITSKNIEGKKLQHVKQTAKIQKIGNITKIIENKTKCKIKKC